jgi:hypothetical protein
VNNASTLCAYPPTSLFYACFYGGVEAFSESFHILFFLVVFKKIIFNNNNNNKYLI